MNRDQKGQLLPSSTWFWKRVEHVLVRARWPGDTWVPGRVGAGAYLASTVSHEHAATGYTHSAMGEAVILPVGRTHRHQPANSLQQGGTASFL